jgi:hypothetical protein
MRCYIAWLASSEGGDNGQNANDYQINADDVGNYLGPDDYDNADSDGDNTGNEPGYREKTA